MEEGKDGDEDGCWPADDCRLKDSPKVLFNEQVERNAARSDPALLPNASFHDDEVRRRTSVPKRNVRA